MEKLKTSVLDENFRNKGKIKNICFRCKKSKTDVSNEK